MTDKDTALRLALEAMKIKQKVTMWENDGDKAKFNKAIKAVEAALLSRSDGEAKDEPVAWANMRDDGATPVMLSISQHPEDRANWMNPVPLYTTPPQRTWVGLTNDEVNNFAAGCHLGNSVQGAIYKAEAKLKEKNSYA